MAQSSAFGMEHSESTEMKQMFDGQFDDDTDVMTAEECTCCCCTCSCTTVA